MADALPDPKLLLLFEAMYRTRSVTRAAEALGQEQPTVSIWLAKLRRQFDDPLFVRTSAGMQPTPRAEAMVEPVQQALARLRAIGERAPGFEPSTTGRRFRLAMTDASHITMLPRLLAELRRTAPRASLDIGYIGSATPRDLESGAVDLALGFLPDLGSGFHQQTLFMQDFVCLVSASHPRVRRTLTLRQFEEEAHVGLSLEGTGHAIVERMVERSQLRRGESLRLPGFLGLAAVVSTTDLVATVPRQIGETLVRNESLRLFECPIRIPRYAVKQHWHARFHHDPGHRWLRGRCAGLFSETGARARRAPRPGDRAGG
ncbi:MAG: LysR family transcriptional regulator [Candidatus Levyibacteriota bacterium]